MVPARLLGLPGTWRRGPGRAADARPGSPLILVLLLQASKSFAETRQAEVRRSMQRAKGSTVFDDEDVPEYGSDIAEDDDDAGAGGS